MPPKQPGQPPSLYEHFQDTQVTVFGQTGTLGELAEMCPVPAEQRDPKAMDRFTANVLQTAGIEIPEQFAAVLEPKTEPEPEQAEPQKLESREQNSYKAPEEQVEPEIEPEREKPALVVKDVLPLALTDKAVVIQPPSEQQLVAILRQQDELHRHAEQQIAEPPAKAAENPGPLDPRKNSQPVLRLPKVHTRPEKPAEKAEPRSFIAEQKSTAKAVVLPTVSAELKAPIAIDREPASEPAVPTKAALPETSLEIPASPGLKAPAPAAEIAAAQPLSLAEQPATVLPEPDVAEIVAADEVILPEPQPGHYPLEMAEPAAVAEAPTEPEFEPSQITGEALSLSESEDDDWIDALLLAHQLEAKDRAKAARQVVLSEFTESLDVAKDVAVQAERLLVALPETVQAPLVEHIENDEPETAAKLEKLVVKIAPAADRLHELAVSDQLDTPEANQIEQEIVETYKELLIQLEFEPDEEKITAFIESVRLKTYSSGVFQTSQHFKDILHERKTGQGAKSGFSQVARSLIDTVSSMETEIARLMVRLSTKSPNPSLIA